MVNVVERSVAIVDGSGFPLGVEAQHGTHMIASSDSTVAGAPEEALQASDERKNVEPLLLGIGATVMGLLLWYAITVFTRLQVGILAITLH